MESVSGLTIRNISIEVCHPLKQKGTPYFGYGKHILVFWLLGSLIFHFAPVLDSCTIEVQKIGSGRSLHHIIFVSYTGFCTFQRGGLLHHHHTAAYLHIFGMSVYTGIQLGISQQRAGFYKRTFIWIGVFVFKITGSQQYAGCTSQCRS